jgi:hypothetical protein
LFETVAAVPFLFGRIVAMIGWLGFAEVVNSLGGHAMSKPPMIDDKAIAVVDGEWRSAREIYAILDEGAFVSTAAALVRLADAGRIERRHDPYRNVKVRRYRLQNHTQCAD